MDENHSRTGLFISIADQFLNTASRTEQKYCKIYVILLLTSLEITCNERRPCCIYLDQIKDRLIPDLAVSAGFEIGHFDNTQTKKKNCQKKLQKLKERKSILGFFQNNY